jgi:hypothetical protein
MVMPVEILSQAVLMIGHAVSRIQLTTVLMALLMPSHAGLMMVFHSHVAMAAIFS